jgi:hypothetical protein
MVAAALSAATTALTIAATDPAAAIGRPRLDHAARARYELLRPQVRSAWPLPSPGMPRTGAASSAWHSWRQSLAAYRDALSDAARASCASSLIHMSTNRLLGNLSDERLARALAGDIIARITRPEALP